MSVKVEMRGLAEFRQQLRNLPETFQQEGTVIVDAHAADFERQMTTAYPKGPTGNLKRGVTRNVTQSRFGGASVVRSRAKHAALFEKGTQVRQTARGLNRGQMPEAKPNEQFVARAIRVRRRMVAALMDLIERAGLTVTQA